MIGAASRPPFSFALVRGLGLAVWSVDRRVFERHGRWKGLSGLSRVIDIVEPCRCSRHASREVRHDVGVEQVQLGRFVLSARAIIGLKLWRGRAFHFKNAVAAAGRHSVLDNRRLEVSCAFCPRGAAMIDTRGQFVVDCPSQRVHADQRFAFGCRDLPVGSPHRRLVAEAGSVVAGENGLPRNDAVNLIGLSAASAAG
jgi:hypothetical protein